MLITALGDNIYDDSTFWDWRISLELNFVIYV